MTVNPLDWVNPNGSGLSPQAQQVLQNYDYQQYVNQSGLSVWYREKVPSSPSFSFDKEGNSRCAREFYIPWAGPNFRDPQAIWTAARVFIGYPTVVSPQPAGYEVVQVSGTITSGSNVISGLGAAASFIDQGFTVNGTGIPSGTGVVVNPESTPASSSGQVILSKNATTSGTFQFWFGVQTSNQNVSLSSSSTITGLQNSSVLVEGETVSGPGIPAGTTISSVTPGIGCTITISSTSSGGLTLGGLAIANGGSYYPPSSTFYLSVLGNGGINGVIHVSSNSSGAVNSIGTVFSPGTGYVNGTCNTTSTVLLSNAATITSNNSPIRFGLYKYISRNLPHTIDNFQQPSFPNFFYANSIGKLDGTIPDGTDIYDTGQFWEGILSLIYTTPAYNILSDATMSGLSNGIIDESSLYRYVTANFNTAGKWQTVPSYSALQYIPGPFVEQNPNGPGTVTYQLTSAGPVSNTSTFFLSQADVTVDWHEIPLSAIPWGVIRRCEGCCNLYPFGGSNNPIAPLSVVGQRATGTMVMLSPSITFRKLITGELGATIHYKFKYYPNGANSVYNIYRLTDQGPVPGYQPAARSAGLNFLGTLTSGFSTITNLPATAIDILQEGMIISGSGIPSGAIAADISQTSAGGPVTVVMSGNATANGQVSLTFGSTGTTKNNSGLIPYADLNDLFRPIQDPTDL